MRRWGKHILTYVLWITWYTHSISWSRIADLKTYELIQESIAYNGDLLLLPSPDLTSSVVKKEVLTVLSFDTHVILTFSSYINDLYCARHYSCVTNQIAVSFPLPPPINQRKVRVGDD